MISCLISTIVLVIVALIVLWILEIILGALGVAVPPNIMNLIRLLVGLLILLSALQCLGFSGGPRAIWWRGP